MPGNIIDELSIKINAEAKSAINALRETEQALNAIKTAAIETSGIKLKSFTSEAALSQAKKLADVLSGLDEKKASTFASAINSIAHIDTTGIKEVADSAKGIAQLTAATEVSPRPLLQLIGALNTMDVDGVQRLSEAARGLREFNAMATMSKKDSGKHISQAFASIESIDTGKIMELNVASQGLSKNFASIATLSRSGGEGLQSAFDALSSADEVKIAAIAKASEGLSNAFTSIASLSRAGGKGLDEAFRALETANEEKIHGVAEAAKGLSQGFTSIASMARSGGKGLTEAFAALEGADTTKISTLAESANGLSQSFSSIAAMARTGGEKLTEAFKAVESADAGRIREVAVASEGLGKNFSSIAAMARTDGKSLSVIFDALNNANLAPLVRLGSAAEGLKNFAQFASVLRSGGKAVDELFDALKRADFTILERLSKIDFSNMRDLADASRVIKNLSDKLKEAEKSGDGAAKSQNRLADSTKRASRSAKKSHNIFSSFGKLLKSIGRIAFYRAIRSAIKAVTQGLSEGIENLYRWSQAWGTSFAPAMDRLATAQQYLKNGFASMFSPLLEYAIPIIDRLIDRFVDFFNFVQEGIAQLTGAATWNRALKVPTTYAEALDDASASAKELKNQLMGFDELNVLNTPNNSGRSKDKDEKDYASMFELVETAAGNNFDSIGKRLADAINSVFDDPEEWGKKGETIAEMIIGGFNNTLDFFKNVNWQNIGASFSEFTSKFVTKIAEWLANDDPFGDLIDTMTNVVCGIIEGIDIGELLKSFAKLFLSLNTALPSVILASLSSVMKVVGTILNKIGLTGMGDAAISASDSLTEARKTYDSWKQQKLDVVFDVIDNGFNNAPSEWETHSNGGSMTPDAGTMYERQRTIEIAIKVRTFINDVEKSIDGIKTDINDWISDMQRGFTNLKLLIRFGIKKFSETEMGQDIQEWADGMAEWFKKHPTPISWVMDLISEERLQKLWDNIKGWFEKYPAPIDWIMDKLGQGERWENFKKTMKEWFAKYPAPIDWIMEKTGRGDKWKAFKDSIAGWFKKFPTPIDWIMDKVGQGEKWKAFKEKIAGWFKQYPSPLSWVMQKTGLGKKLKETWTSIYDWFQEHPAPIIAAFHKLAYNIKHQWEEFKQTDTYKKLEAFITPVIQSIPDAFKAAWKAFLEWRDKNNSIGKLILAVQQPEFKEKVQKAWNEVTGWLKDKVLDLKIKTPHFSWVSGDPNPLTWVNPAKRPHIQVDWYASGGYINPSSYSLMGMGENGIPEILGTVGGRSAVAGGAEITGIRDAIYEQGQREEALLRNLITAVNNKDLSLVANSSTGRWVNRALNAYAGVTG